MRFFWVVLSLLALLLASCLLTSCSGEAGGSGRQGGIEPDLEPPPMRGVIMISVDTLRADHLGCYGHDRPTSPFLDRLCAESVVFERAYAHAPATLISHMSLFTGLYPPQHAVGVSAGTNRALSPEIPLLTERLRAAGLRTEGHTEGGYMHGGHGFARGFEDYTDEPFDDPTDVEQTFERGVDFLRTLEADERFFLFLHTYSVHDPYLPPAEYRQELLGTRDEAQALTEVQPTGEWMKQFHDAERQPSEAQVTTLEQLYDAGIRYVDDQLRLLYEQLETLGMVDDVALIIVSDHGEEFLEHGRLLHTQTFPEALQVPLIVHHPHLEPRRVEHTVGLVDIAPTLYQLFGIEREDHFAGSSLLPHLLDEASASAHDVYAEVEFITAQRSLFTTDEDDGGRYLMIEHRPAIPDADGAWISRQIEIDWNRPRMSFQGLSYHQPRRLEVVVDDQVIETVELQPDAWRAVDLALPIAGDQRVMLRAEDCVRPADLGAGADQRCLSFKIGGMALRRYELYDLDRDPGAQHDLSRLQPDRWRRLAGRLARMDWQPLAVGIDRPMEDEQRLALEALGYL